MSLGYTVTSLGQLRMRDTWRVETLHSDTRHRLYWVTRGQGRVSVGCITRGFGPNTAVFVPAGTLMSLELPGQIQGLSLHIPNDPLIAVPQEAFHLRIPQMEAQVALTGSIERIEREMAARAPAMDRALRAYGLLISTWIERELAKQDGTILRDKAHRLVERFSMLLAISFHTGAGVADYADRLGVTPTHLSRVCKEASGKPAHALITERVMHDARRMLADTDLAAQAVSEALGFSSPAYFTRAFSQVTGMTPTAFRAAPRRR